VLNSIKTTNGWRALVLILGILVVTGGLSPSACAQAPDSDQQPAATGPRVSKALLLDATRAGERIVAVGERGIVLYSDDEGATWSQGAVPVDATLTSVNFADAHHGWATGHDAIILATEDGGANWVLQHIDPSLDVPLLDVYFESPTSGFAVGGRGNLFRTTDGGKTWSNQVILTRDDFDSHLFQISKAVSGSYFLASEQGVLYRSDDGGTTWTQLDSPYRGSFFGVITTVRGRIIAFAMLGHVAVSDDNGTTWRMVPTGTDKSFMSATISASGAVVLAGLDGAIAVSRDDGDSFELRSQPDRRKIARLLQKRDGSWLAFGEGGARSISLDVK
jgi:photosystem II stability/assembly factor-like uncharacterized protein